MAGYAVGDLQHSGGIMLEVAVASDWLPEFASQSMVLEIDGTTVATTEGNAATAMSLLRSPGWPTTRPLAAAALVITGARLILGRYQ